MKPMSAKVWQECRCGYAVRRFALIAGKGKVGSPMAALPIYQGAIGKLEMAKDRRQHDILND